MGGNLVDGSQLRLFFWSGPTSADYHQFQCNESVRCYNERFDQNFQHWYVTDARLNTTFTARRPVGGFVLKMTLCLNNAGNQERPPVVGCGFGNACGNTTLPCRLRQVARLAGRGTISAGLSAMQYYFESYAT